MIRVSRAMVVLYDDRDREVARACTIPSTARSSLSSCSPLQLTLKLEAIPDGD
jgi:hypothetical protein